MFEDHMKRTLFGRLHAILDEAAHVPNTDNVQLVHDVVKEAVRYGGVVREGLSPDLDDQRHRKHRFWHDRSEKL